MQVKTKQLKITDTLGKRISVMNTWTRKRITVGWDYSLNADENHKAAAEKLAGEPMVCTWGGASEGYCLFDSEERVR